MPAVPRLLVVAGPTATGKSDLALAVCRRLDGEVISADSAMVYRGLDLGTAKPDADARAAVPHHLIDIRDPREPFSVAEYRPLAEAAVDACAERRRLPVITGGTGLYIRDLLAAPSLPPVPPRPALRAALSRRDPGALHAELAEVDPVAAARIPAANVRRVVRALEVQAVTGRPISAFWAESAGNARRPALLVVLDRPTDVLRRRVAERVHHMLAAGLIGEVRNLLAAGVPPGAQSMSSLGYRQTVAWLGSGRTSAELAAEIVAATMRYAKRQRTWFRREPDARWLDVGDGPVAEGLPRVLALWEEGGR